MRFSMIVKSVLVRLGALVPTSPPPCYATVFMNMLGYLRCFYSVNT